MQKKIIKGIILTAVRRLFASVALVMIFHLTSAAQEKNRVIQMARLEIDPAKLSQYEQLLKEEIETSIRIEPGVISLQAVSEKNSPTHITIFETYADNDAYQAHLKRPHFLKYKVAVKDMVKHLELLPVNLIVNGRGKTD